MFPKKNANLFWSSYIHRYFCLDLINNSLSPFRSTLPFNRCQIVFWQAQNLCQGLAVPLTLSYFCVSFKWLEFLVYKFLMNSNGNFRWGYVQDQLFSIHCVKSTYFPISAAWKSYQHDHLGHIRHQNWIQLRIETSCTQFWWCICPTIQPASGFWRMPRLMWLPSLKPPRSPISLANTSGRSTTTIATKEKLKHHWR